MRSFLVLIRRPESAASSKGPEPILEFHRQCRSSNVDASHSERYGPCGISESFYVEAPSEDMPIEHMAHCKCRVEICEVHRSLIVINERFYGTRITVRFL